MKHARIFVEVEEYDEYVNHVGHDIRRWRCILTAESEHDETEAEVPLVILAIDKTDPPDGRYVSDYPYEMLTRRTDEHYDWEKGETVAQYSAGDPVTITGALFRILEDISRIIRTNDIKPLEQ